MAAWLDKLQGLIANVRAAAGSPACEDNGTTTTTEAESPTTKRFKPVKKDPLGDRGENVAAKHLRDKGYRILNRNFKCPVGEIDIIARDPARTLVFVEVKTRAYDDPAPEEQVNPEKMHQLTKAARYYLGRYGTPQPPARFDVVAIVWPQGQQPVIRHIENAFEPTY
jgi:putative endonuclease